MRKRIFSMLMVFVLAVLLIAGSRMESKSASTSGSGLFSKKETLVIWYTDESLTNYIDSVAYEYYESESVKVTPVLVSGVEYLEAVYDASLKNEGPDLFVVGNDSLEKAYLSGIGSQILDSEGVVNHTNYPESAINAMTYNDKIVGIPFYFETSVLLYNKTYMEDFVQKKLEAMADAAEGEAAMDALEAAGDEPEDEAEQAEDENSGEGAEQDLETDDAATENLTVENAVPDTIERILSFADEYDAPEQVEAVFKWDVTDIFYNYFVVGNYINVGGSTGDDPSQIQIYNENVTQCLTVYQGLNQFFSIDTKEVEYASVLQEFIEGRLVFTVATTDVVDTLEQAKSDGTFLYEYEVGTLPEINGELETKGLSITNAVVINGYSKKKQRANDFARFLAYDNGGQLYERSGKICSRKDISYDNENVNTIIKEYEDSVALPKMLETGNFWIQLEVAFSNIWQGADVEETLKALDEQIRIQCEKDF